MGRVVACPDFGISAEQAQIPTRTHHAQTTSQSRRTTLKTVPHLEASLLAHTTVLLLILILRVELAAEHNHVALRLIVRVLLSGRSASDNGKRRRRGRDGRDRLGRRSWRVPQVRGRRRRDDKRHTPPGTVRRPGRSAGGNGKRRLAPGAGGSLRCRRKRCLT